MTSQAVPGAVPRTVADAVPREDAARAPSVVGTTLARMATAGMAALLVAVAPPADASAVLVLCGVWLAWLAVSSWTALHHGWSARQALGVALVDVGLMVAVVATSGGATSNALRVLWLAPLVWAVVADAAATKALLAVGGLAFLGLWVPRLADGDDDVVRILGTFGSSYLACVAIAFVAIRLRAQAEQQRLLLVGARMALTRELGQVERDERERLAVQLHDGPLQSVISARQDLTDHLEGDPDALRIGVSTLDESVVALRAIATDLYPDQDGGSSIGEQLRSIAAAWEARGDFVVRLAVDPAIADREDPLVVGMVTELVGNAAKHAHPSTVDVRLRDEERRTVLVVSDDGVGMDPDARRRAERTGHIGLRSLERRVGAVGGWWQIRSASERGTVVRVELPR